MLILNIDKIKKITDILFQHLDELEIKEVEIDEDYYWEIIDFKTKYDVYKMKEEVANELTIGQLSEDIFFLDKNIDSDKDLIVSYDFTKLAQILIYIGYKIGY